MQVKTINGTEVLIEGTGSETVLMLHGWPDTRALWEKQVEAFKPHFRCVRFTWPGFEPGAASVEHSLDALIGLCEAVVREVSPDKPVILLVHDWGCLFGYHFAMRHPDRVSRVVGVDIGDAGSREFKKATTIPALLGIVGYQLWLAAAWRIGGGVGENMSRWLSRQMGVPTPPDQITVAKNYPYYSTWTGKYKGVKTFRPACPMLFVYGTRKPFMFHSPQWEAWLNARPGSKAVAMDTDHWPMLRRPDEFNTLVLRWLLSHQSNEVTDASPAVL
ncbi:alpha/beta fold hydrolase [Pseudoduganella chitinolytica]|uniref:Alpha/beta hydrolase n=1 Tax=Pseudoduganella chitinolytica TaxID=34070 RepID=A0ABY8BLU7_9BURK|nr:alpha/beta hydrolase [Pseudoduganella chitinolytica]WEF35344.1 alpha/beta hydrolase [Pseudoduganella chitinolytica]